MTQWTEWDTEDWEGNASGVLVLSGYGVQLRVQRGHLIAHDGIGRERRTLRLTRVQPNLKRLVVLGTAGLMSLDALQWLQDAQTEWVLIGRDGEVLGTSIPKGRTNPELVRAQALVSASEHAVELSREFVLLKLEGQLAVLERIEGSDSARRALEFEIESARRAENGEELLAAEAQAAQAYWKAWRGLPVQFTRPKRVPKHWRSVGSRTSPYSEGNRMAVTPASAMLNYLYTILQAETRLACFEMGLDPGIGLFHATMRGRDSLVFDLMEPARADVDDFFLDLLEERVFERSEFFENGRGIVRIMPPLNRLLVETAPQWRRAVGGVVESVARELMRLGGGGDRGALARRKGPTYRADVLATPLTQSRRRGGKAKRDSKRARKVSTEYHRNRAWERAHPDAPAISYESEILPGLAGLLAEDIQKATGLSLAYSAEIRRGKVIPHRRHWSALRELGADG